MSDKLPYGVSKTGKKFEASVGHEGKQVYLGRFHTMEEAAATAADFRSKHPALPRGARPKHLRVDKPSKPSLRKAINDMCKACIYDPGSGGGTWRQQVEACTAYECPLYETRPKSIRDNKGKRKDDNSKLLGDIDVRELPVSVSEAIHNQGTD